MIGSDFKGILGSDCWWAYELIDPESRQACWEHLKRDFIRHAEGLAEQKEFGEAGVELTKGCSRPGAPSRSTSNTGASSAR